jgi:hypothetical protein
VIGAECRGSPTSTGNRFKLKSSISVQVLQDFCTQMRTWQSISRFTFHSNLHAASRTNKYSDHDNTIDSKGKR